MKNYVFFLIITSSKIWQYVSEVAALQVLQKNFSRISPIICQMLEGKEITTPDGEVCIRIKRL
jgi:hypothetical protein